MNIEEMITEFTECSETEAIALGGSRAVDHADERSDYDIYIYCNQKIPEDARRDILKKYCSIIEIGNHYWENEDNCTLKSGIDIDIIYRSLKDFEQNIENIVYMHRASNGYTTCMWHNLNTCRILYDKNGCLEKLKNRFNIPYPKKLKAEIIRKNRALLSGVLPSYDMQIKKALNRKDIVSINHRITEFLASYFDILFAVNELTHPGEKRLIQLCKEQCSLLPKNFEENLIRLSSVMFSQEALSVINEIIEQLDKMLLKNNLIFLEA